MEMENKTKRSYTIPVMLVIMTLMMLVIVILLSNYLVQKQQDSLEDGKWLAEKYEDALQFAQNLHKGADLLLSSADEQAVEGKMLLAQAVAHSRNFIDLMAEAEHRESKIRVREARKQYAEKMEKLHEKLGVTGEPGQWFSALNPEVLETVRDGAAQMNESLQGFQVPTLDFSFRIMAAGEGWVEPALGAAESWTNLIEQLQ